MPNEQNQQAAQVLSSFQISPPERFDFAKQEKWPHWIRRFERFRIASQLDQNTGESQVNTLIYCMGDEADDILSSFNLINDQGKDYNTVKSKFDSHFIVRRNTIYERAKFNKRSQVAGESVDTFITSLHALAEHCNYGQLKEELIRDRIVVGILDVKLSEKLQLDHELTLEKAVTQARQSESVKKQQVLMRPDLDKEVNAVNRKQFPKKKKKFHKQQDRSQQQRSQQQQYNTGQNRQQAQTNVCTRCGGPKHSKQQCPAVGSTCFLCNKANHYSQMCRTRTHPKSIHVIDQANPDDFCIGSINQSSCDADEWFVQVQLKSGQVLKLKLDTGAQANVMPLHTYNSIKESVSELQPTDARLTGYGGHRLSLAGKCHINCYYKNNPYNLEFYVVEAQSPAALGLKACMDMKLIKPVLTISQQNTDPILQEYEEVFSGIGKMDSGYTITLKPDAIPVIHAARSVPVALKEKVKNELQRMEQHDIIRKVEQPTDWVNSMVVVAKANDKVRICLDPKNLNENIRREHYKIPTLQDITSQLAGQKVFSVADVSSAYWTIPLDEESSLLTTFNTPFGRYCYQRLPFGINSAQEIMQKKMEQAYEGLEGTFVLVDDILITGKDKKEHDERLRAMLQRTKEKGIKLNPEKLQLRKSAVTFFGERITDKGLTPDPEKVKAVHQMKPPNNKAELETYLGMFTYLSQYTPKLAEKTAPLRELTKQDTVWDWGPHHDTAFQEIKNIITKQPGPVLAYYDPDKPVVVQVDASQKGLGAVLLQEGKPVAFASKALTPTQERYAQIEKEALAIVFGCEKFHHYIFGRSVVIESDHKPLEIIATKPLHAVPLRLQRMLIRLQLYNPTIRYKSGREIPVADTLSRHYIESGQDDTEIEAHIHEINKAMPITSDKWAELKLATAQDDQLQQLARLVRQGWPEKQTKVPSQLRDFWNVRDEITESDGLLFKAQRIIIPSPLRNEMLAQIHVGHLGMEKCKLRAKDTIYWPGINAQIESMVQVCQTCQEYQNCHQREPMISQEIPSRPWQKVASDLFFWNNTNYIVVVDYYSRWFEMAKLTNITSGTVITQLKSIFAKMGIPEILVSDNATQYQSQEMTQFATEWGFKQITSSPLYPRSNGLAERTVQTAKNLLEKSKQSGQDPYLSLINYRNTPIDGIGSPAQLLMSRRLRTTIPVSPYQLAPTVISPEKVVKKRKEIQLKQKVYYDRGTKPLDPLHPGDNVRILRQGTWQPATVTTQADTPRSYNVTTPDGAEYRRNRQHLRKVAQIPSPASNTQQPNTSQPDTPLCSQVQTRSMTSTPNPTNGVTPNSVTTRSGRVVKPVKFPDCV